MKSNSQQLEKLKRENKALTRDLMLIKKSTSYQLAQFINQNTRSKKNIALLPFSLIKFWFELRKQKPKKVKAFLPSAFSIEETNSAIEKHSKSTGDNLIKGISVIIPCYMGERFIERCLSSLSKQTLSKDLFEVLIVLNGPEDRTPAIIREFESELDIQLFKLNEANCSAARNCGIDNLNRQYCLNLDVDDELSPNYLSNLYKVATPETIVFSNLMDCYQDTNEISPITSSVSKVEKEHKLSFWDIAQLTTLNAAKLIPSTIIKSLSYDVTLNSSEDVDLFSKLFVTFRPQITLCDDFLNTYYLRHVVENSISRKKLSLDFNVNQRVNVIKKLDRLLQTEEHALSRHFLEGKIEAQSNLIVDYLEVNPQDYSIFVERVNESNILFNVFQLVASKLAKTLVISYCFAPYADTSAIVMAKRIVTCGLPVNAICNKMDRVRDKDLKLTELTKPYIGYSDEINTPTSFSNWKAIAKFSSRALEKAIHWHNLGAVHDNLYSRAMWPASHFAAALVKIKYPNIKWIAEFSDPLYVDVKGNCREGNLDRNWLSNNGVFDFLNKHQLAIPASENLFLWCEYLAYSLADEIVFTNSNQQEYMESYTDDQQIKELVKGKAEVSPHPTLPKALYESAKLVYDLDESFVNLAYFGSFYETRGLGEVIDALIVLKSSGNVGFKLHIFTTKQAITSLKNEKKYVDNKELIVLNPYVSFFEFLSLTQKFDCLVVRDAETNGSKVINPYLPSKLSDYIGSDKPIWGVYEIGSPLYKVVEKNPQMFGTELFNVEAAVSVLKELKELKELNVA